MVAVPGCRGLPLGSGRRRPRAPDRSHEHRRSRDIGGTSSGQPTALCGSYTGPALTGHGLIPPDRSPQNRDDQRHASSGWGEAPLVLANTNETLIYWTQVRKRIVSFIVKKLSLALLAAAAAAALQISIAPAAHANCIDEGFAFTHPDLCPVASIAAADAVDEARQRAEGRPPCYTPEGVAYYTPFDAPCA